MSGWVAVLLAAQQQLALPSGEPRITFQFSSEYTAPPDTHKIVRKGEGAWYRRLAPGGAQRFFDLFLETAKFDLTSDRIARDWVPQDASRMGEVLTSHGEEKWKGRTIRTVEIRMNHPTWGPTFIRGEALALRPRSMSVTLLGPQEFEAEIRAEARRIVESLRVDPESFTDEELFAELRRLRVYFWTGVVAAALYLIAWVVVLRRSAHQLDLPRTAFLAGLVIVWGMVLVLAWNVDSMVKLVGAGGAPVIPFLAGLAMAPLCVILVLVRVVRRISA